MATRVAINGSTLRWAREIMGLQVESLAQSMSVNPERIRSFENGELKPTFNQLVNMAKVLDRPPAFFFVPPPETPDIPETVDFRGFATPEIPISLRKELKRAEAHRRTYLKLAEEVDQPFEFGRIGYRNLKTSAEHLRRYLEIDINFLPESRNSHAVWNYWRSAFEQKGFLVFQTTRISLDVFRALSISHTRNPIIVVNGGDYPNAKVFSLFHEFAHLANSASGLCGVDDSIDAEVVANRFAGEFLMPEDQLLSFYNSSRAIDKVDSSARHFRVSKLAMALRLKGLGLISQDQVEAVINEFDQRRARERDERENDDFFIQPWKLRYRDLSPRYLEIVFHALNNQKVNEMDVSYFLNARIPMVEQIKDEYYRRVSS